MYPSRLPLAERLFWCAILICIVALKIQPSWQPFRSNDSFQYLSVADNLQRGVIGSTSLLHFDVERSHGKVPAPLTTFPIGYPVLVGVFEASGFSGETAGLLVSLLATLGSIFVLDILGRRVGLSTTARRWVLAVFVVTSRTTRFAAAVMSESAFTLVSLGALVLLISALQSTANGRPRASLAIAAGLAFGLSYWLRYAGLFVLLGLLPVVALFFAARRRDFVRQVLIAICAGGLIVILGMIRNIILVGTWRGGNTKEVHHPALEIVRGFVIAIKNLMFGSSAMSDSIALKVTLVLLLVVGCAAGVAVILKSTRGADRASVQMDFAAAILAIVAATYVACLTYVARHTTISFGARYLYPMLPVVLVLTGVAITGVERRIAGTSARWGWRGLWSGVAVLYALLHVSQFFREPSPSTYDVVANRLDQPFTAEATARRVILSLAGPDGVVMSNFGQATGYVLRRPVLSLVEPELSSVTWDESNVRAAMKRFSVKVLVVHRIASDARIDAYPSPFVERLATGEVPSWLHKIGESKAVVIYGPGEAL